MVNSNRSLVVVGLTPTVQRTMLFSRFAVGAVNRARETWVTASGKAVNVARVISRLNAPAKLIQILGGNSGRWLAEQLDNDNVPHQSLFAEDDAPTRTCTTLLVDNGPTTELVEEARPVGVHDVALVEAATKTALLDAVALCCSGSLPPDVPADFYARLVREAKWFGIPAIVDAQKAPLAAVLAEKPFLVKPNREEAAATLGFSLTGDGDSDSHTAVDKLLEAGAEWALVSMGREGALLGHRSQRWRVQPPTVEAVNPIGSGDSLTAGLVVGHFIRGLPMPEAVAFGTACAAANTLSLTSGVVDPADAERLLQDVVLREVR